MVASIYTWKGEDSKAYYFATKVKKETLSRVKLLLEGDFETAKLEYEKEYIQEQFENQKSLNEKFRNELRDFTSNTHF